MKRIYIIASALMLSMALHGCAKVDSGEKAGKEKAEATSKDTPAKGKTADKGKKIATAPTSTPLGSAPDKLPEIVMPELPRGKLLTVFFSSNMIGELEPCG